MANYLDTQMTSMADLVRGVTGEVNPLSVTSMISSLLNITGTTDTTGVIAYLERGLSNPLVDSSIESRLTFPLQATSMGPYAFANCTYLEALLKASGIKYASHAFDGAGVDIIPTNYNSNRSGTYNKGTAAPAREPNHSGESIDVDPAVKAEILNADYITFNDNMHGLASTVRAIDSTATGELTMRQMVEHVSSLKAGGTNHILARLIERSIETLAVPDGTISIGPDALHSCTHLSSAIAPSSVNNFADGALAHCAPGLHFEVYDGCGITDETVSGTEDNIEDYSLLSRIHATVHGLLRTSTIKLEKESYNYASETYKSTNITFSSPVKLVSVGYNGGRWGDFAPYWLSRLDFSDVDVIIFKRADYDYNGAYQNCVGLVSLNLVGVSAVDSDVFAGCKSLVDIAFPTASDRRLLLFSGAFDNIGIQSLHFSGNISLCGGGIFRNCHSLQSLCVDYSTTGYSTFAGCTNLTSVTLASTVKTMELAVFESCYHLMHFVIPSTVTSVRADVFSQCHGLERAFVEIDSAYSWYEHEYDYWDSSSAAIAVGSRTPVNDYITAQSSMYAWKINNATYYTYRDIDDLRYGEELYSKNGTAFTSVKDWTIGSSAISHTVTCYCSSAVFYSNGNFRYDYGINSSCFVFS